jgi:hypothetical protein
MSDSKNFLARWSSRKLASRTAPAPDVPNAQQSLRDETDAVENSAITEKATDADAPVNQSFDPAQLPPLDSIGPGTDIAAFLHRDVPPELTRAALRRAWTSDPAIKDFVGPVENGWDFNDPSAMAGFGPISAKEVARLAGNVIAALPEAAPASAAAEESTSDQNSELASSHVQPAGSLEAPKTEQPPRDSGDIAAQQSKTGDKS